MDENSLPPLLTCGGLLNALDAIMPRLKLWEGFLLPAGPSYSPDIIQKWREVWGEDKVVEIVANEVTIAELFRDCADYEELKEEQIDRLARFYASMLEAEARRVLPTGDYKVVVEYSQSPIPTVQFPDGSRRREPSAHDTRVFVYRVRGEE